MLGMYRSERKLFGCSIVASIGTHLSVVVLMLLLPFLFQSAPPPKPPEEQPVEVEFESDNSGQEVPAKAETDSPNPNAPAPEKLDAPPAPTKPIDAPTEEPPPVPPPPQPLPPPPQSVAKMENVQPVQEQAMDSPADSAVTLPPVVAPLTSSSQSKSPAPPSPSPMPDALPTEHQTFSKITKPEKATQEVPDTSTLEAAISANRADQKQTHPPKSAANPRQGGAPNGGGARNGDITKGLSKGQQGKIASSVRRCYTQDTAAKDYANNIAHMEVTVDETGEARIVKFDAATQAKMNSDPAYRAFAERSRDAVLNPTCSKLPIPTNLLGKRNTVKFVFRP
ncbi:MULTISPECIES: hypothetical protein [Commensalibacter]|uniref:TonB periplasmic protein n=2 Tax=Commensalibacter TaxID=1079922 RepID=W7E5W0_9PROT|nr:MULTISPECIES: hypothetical protein [Commensalibacter]EUK18471.1 TonB periplasmic protein [Commensalibacter papalotli (ex Servin-Garciduenas et al. 2014)]CAI3933165.1 unnamed protein product [Commensalibacter papalotli (ex Botero et al. 2024)]CAI3942514.1 unnamed protein product [Commensalibacter papalotli (ex Botero et al. 2024)]